MKRKKKDIDNLHFIFVLGPFKLKKFKPMKIINKL